MDETIMFAKYMKGYKMDNNNLNVAAYADDAILIAAQEDDLQTLLYKFNSECKQYNMVTSTVKTKAMTIAVSPVRCKLAAGDEIAEQVMEVNYLGVTSYGSLGKEIISQITKKKQGSGGMYDVFEAINYSS